MRIFVITVLTSLIFTTIGSAKSVEMTSAQIYFSQGEYHKAIEFYEKAIADMEMAIAEAEQKGKSNKGAEKNLCQAYYEIGQCYQTLRDYEKMSDYFTKSLGINDKYNNEIADIREELWIKFFNEGVPLFNEGKYEDALDKFIMVAIIDPGNMSGLKQRGLCHLQLKQYDEALKDFEEVIKLDTEGEDVGVRINRANILYLKELKDEAAAAYEEVLTMDPENGEIISRLAMIYQEQGQSRKAIGMYEQALKRKPDDSNLYFNLGILYFHMEDFDKAIESFNKVVEMNPGDVESLMNLVNSLWKIELYGQAIPYLEQVVEIETENINAWQFLFVAYTKEAEREGIKESLRKELITKGKEAYDKYKELSEK